MSEQQSGIAGLRQDLDEVDSGIVRLIAQRREIISAIAQVKEQGSGAIQDPAREQAVLDGVAAMAAELGVSASLVRRIFRELIGDSVAQQARRLNGDATGHRVRVAFQGVAHAFSDAAAQKYLAGRDLDGDLTGYPTFRDAADALLAGQADLAVLPIENTTAGSINEVYALLREHELFIVGEETWKVDHCLAAVADVPLSAVTEVLSHPQGHEQCAQFLRSLPQAALVPYFDTAGAMRAVAERRDPAAAAIGSPEAAAANGLVILRRNISDSEDNYTRFVVLARDPAPVDVRIPCKTSLILVTRHEEGALLRCLEVLSGSGHSMTKLESRPRPGRPWEYMFFVDFEGNVANPGTAAALDEVRSAALYVKVLGSYPAKALREPARGGELPAVPQDESPAEMLEAVAAAPAPARSSRHYKLVDRASRQADTVIRVGDVLIGGDGFAVMAGPCSVESEEQINATAKFVRDHGAHVLRGGVFKPRTSPYSFQGLGWQGLDLLVAAGRQSDMPVVTEVMAVDQVQRMAKAADILQVGTRNMQNFDLLRELGKVDRPVLLKRGLSSTIEEWLAAAEYVVAQGNQQVILCERGIRTYESATRNTLDLSAVAVVRERSHLPIIVDPSHGTGSRAYVAPMAWAARAAGAHGILVEVHPEPDQALSDSEQSLSPPEFAALMRHLAEIPASPARG
jgi:chorismate mutase/prephenate dehydratase